MHGMEGMQRSRGTAQPADDGFGALVFEPLEPRLLLSASPQADLTVPYLPPQHYLFEPGGYLTGPAAGEPLAIATSWLADNADQLGLTGADVAASVVTSMYTSAATGVTHIHLRQFIGDLEIVNANLSVNVSTEGRIINVGGGFVPGAASTAALPDASLTAPDALVAAGLAVGLSSTVDSAVADVTDGPDSAMVLVNPDYSQDPIPARLHYVASEAGPRLAWDMVLRTADDQHWYEVSVDAETGECLYLSDWVNAASYNVYAAPTQSPDDGDRTIVVDGYDPEASPYGWHDADGVAGADYTDTRGNNVYAQEDAKGDDEATEGYRPDGGTERNFDFALDLGAAPSVSRDAAIVNLFYWNNYLHDLHYRYGFDEASGNFQFLNYTGEGLGGDGVLADAQDNSSAYKSVNNSNFATPPDGQSPRMQMYVFTYNTPLRDGALDCQVVIHEYGHGVAARLVGGSANTSSLDARQSRALTEGLCDWWALMLTMKPTDFPGGAYPFAAYATGHPQEGPGLRRYAYSYDMALNPLTFGDFGNNPEVHMAGEIWCSALWDMTWLLIERYGYGENVAGGYDGADASLSGGNNLALRLVTDALKLMPVNPSYLDARDAVLQADVVLTGGANSGIIWEAFARRGMGVSASDGGDANSIYVVEAFDTPSDNLIVESHSPTNLAALPVGEVALRFNRPVDPASFAAGDDVMFFTGPDGSDLRGAVTSATWDDARTLRITFASQATPGPYTLTLGAALTSNEGRGMDQDLDGLVGETFEDAYTATFEAVAVAYQADMSTDPGWNLGGGEAPERWQYGAPGGLSGDPSAGYTGKSVIGYNLEGNYPDELAEPQYATTPAFSTAGMADVTLGFWNWLGVEEAIYDQAAIEVWDGQAWRTVWQHEGATVAPAAWSYVEYVLPEAAWGKAEVMLRWAMGPSDEYVNYCGWNIDDVVVWGDVTGTDIAGPGATGRATRSPDGSYSRVVFTFDEPMDTASFDPADDVARFEGPGGDLKPAVTSYDWIDSRTLDIRFEAQSSPGSYTLAIGPGITDNAPSLNPMDQDRDGLAGEADDDHAAVSFSVRAGLPVLYSADMETDPGWTLDAGNEYYVWEYGVPAGRQGDPSSGYTGEKVIGYNLYGRYPNSMSAPQYATTPAFSTEGHTDIILEFRAWLTVEQSTYDHAGIDVWDGSRWLTLWDHVGPTFVTKGGWSYRYYVLPESIADQPEVMLRWSMGPTDSASTFCGWNIDDVIVTGSPVVDPAVVGRHVFYNNCAFDHYDPGASGADDAAIAPPPSLFDASELGKQLGKQALRPGETATAIHYTNYSKGLNGIMVDIAGLAGRTPTAADFRFLVGNSDDPGQWTAAPAPLSVTVRRGEGVGGSDRVTIIWADENPLTPGREHGAISNQWLEVTVLADGSGGSLGLAEDDVFYFGNAIGDTYDQAGDAKVNATDILAVRQAAPHAADNPAPVYDAYDFDRDGRVNPDSADEEIVSRNQTNFLSALKLITAPTTSPAPPAGDWLFGDANRDGRVDTADLRVVMRNLGRTGATWDQGDFDGDAAVTAADYAALKANMGKTAPLPDAAEGPEPGRGEAPPATILHEPSAAEGAAALTDDADILAAGADALEDPIPAPGVRQVQIQGQVAAFDALSATAPGEPASPSLRGPGTPLPPQDAAEAAGASDVLVEPMLGKLKPLDAPRLRMPLRRWGRADR